jgi:hypothetical protein
MRFTTLSVPYDSSYAQHPMSVGIESVDAPPLEELGVRAPDGTDVSLTDLGELLISSTGDLFIEGTFPAVTIPGLTRVMLTTPGRIVITDRIELSEAALDLEAGVIFNDPTPVPPGCQRLAFERRVTRKLGKFSLVATPASPVEIDVRPESERNRIRPGTDQLIGIALLGLRSLDVSDIDVETLRLGRGEAVRLEPYCGSIGNCPDTSIRRVNRDRYPDLLSVFRVSEAEVAFGDPELCLSVRKLGGNPVEGCDRIDARPASASRR